ncbi:sugar kinase [Roseiconus lacunae]|uniref:sugar kinase n=1 Tax=Roseiconus lacunae TaxID=2605694 RepID=UPI00308AE9E7|nr:sugar kinase [Stieleria sp. HD01]
MKSFVTIGEIMGRFCTQGFARFEQAVPGTMAVTFGGAEASIAALLARLGNSAAFVTALPNNPIGHACVTELRAMNVDSRQTVFVDDSRLGLYFVEQAVGARAGQVIYDRDRSAFATTSADRYDWEAIFANADWLVITGITPAISKLAAEMTCEAIGRAKRSGIRIAMDMNFRSKLWRWDPSCSPAELAFRWMSKLAREVDVLIGGVDDFVNRLGFPQDEKTALPTQILNAYENVQHVVLTRRSGSGGEQRFSAELHSRDQDPAVSGTANITSVVDRIGTGDAFAAALIDSLASDRFSSAIDTIEFAVAACQLAHTIPGDFSLIERSEILEAMAGSSAGRIRR